MEHNDKLWFRLACPAFDGKCSIYPERPSTCGKHQCDLLKSVNNGTIPLEKGLALVQQMKHVFIELDIMLDDLVGEEETKEITQRFYRFFQSKGKETKTDAFHSKYADLLQKYAIFSFLKENYFYGINNDAIDN